jgi:hypothetical protein
MGTRFSKRIAEVCSSKDLFAVTVSYTPSTGLIAAMPLQGMTKQELEALKLRIEAKAAIP